MKRKEGGFTIVEVVIAVTVIGVLLIIAMTTLNGLTAKGRDATRRARAEAMALDLELIINTTPLPGGMNIQLATRC